MLDLKAKYLDAKNRALKLMQKGNIHAYLAQLTRVEQLHLQLINNSLVAENK